MRSHRCRAGVGLVDLQLLRTFLEVSDTGSFGTAAARLFVTQSAVSLRVHRLEAQLGRPLFDRTTAGVVLTQAGREFRGFATLILRNWEQARQRVSALDGLSAELAVAAQPSLWPRFGFRWLDRLRDELPKTAIRAEMARPDALAGLIMTGSVQAILSHVALIRPGLTTEHLMEDQLVMVATWPDATVEAVNGAYGLVDWGQEFLRAHDEALPILAERKLVLGFGTLTVDYLKGRRLAAYLPARVARKPLGEGAVHLVRDAPSFPNPSWVIWRDDMDPAHRSVASKTLSEAVSQAEAATAEVIDQL
jgi:LysR family transcriptional regulator, flagellar master operon regulator